MNEEVSKLIPLLRKNCDPEYVDQIQDKLYKLGVSIVPLIINIALDKFEQSHVRTTLIELIFELVEKKIEVVRLLFDLIHDDDWVVKYTVIECIRNSIPLVQDQEYWHIESIKRVILNFKTIEEFGKFLVVKEIMDM